MLIIVAVPLFVTSINFSIYQSANFDLPLDMLVIPQNDDSACDA
jgi:hypothetical protein